MQAPTLVATYGGTTSNTYILYADADLYITSYLIDDAAWAAAAVDKPQTALVVAAKQIDAHVYHGSRYYFRQALAFPRTPPDVDIEGYPFVGTEQTQASEQSFLNFLEQDVYLSRQRTRVQ